MTTKRIEKFFSSVWKIRRLSEEGRENYSNSRLLSAQRKIDTIHFQTKVIFTSKRYNACKIYYMYYFIAFPGYIVYNKTVVSK